MGDIQFYLPNLKKNTQITPPAKTGLWKNDSKAIIRGISDAISLGENAQGVSSIPDIWARPLMFQNFLFSVHKKLDPNLEFKQSLNQIEQRAFQEWKGLLSILALSSTKLSYDKIEIVPFAPKENDRFCKALSSLVPNKIFLERNQEYEWTDILLIRYNGVPVGAFSPTTLVYTAIDYNRDFRKKFESGAGKYSIVLDSDGFLCPPTKEGDLLAVGEWVTNVKKKLSIILNTKDEKRETDKSLAAMIGVLLEIWLLEIREQLIKLGVKIYDREIGSDEVKVSTEIPYFDDNKVPEFLQKYEVYRILLYPLISEDFPEVSSLSNIELNLRRNYLKYNTKEIKHVLIVSDKLYSDDYRIWGQLRYNAFGTEVSNIISNYFYNESGQEIKGPSKDISLAKYDILWIRPELYFLTATLLSSKSESTLLIEDELVLNVSSKYLLPFKKEILYFFSPEEIRNLLKPSYEEREDKVIFSFSLPIIGMEDLRIKKIYKKKNADKGEGVINEIDTPVVEIFPHYLGINWRRYYLFHGKAETFTLTPLLKEDNYTFPYTERDSKLPNNDQKVGIYEIIGDNAFPEALEFSDKKMKPFGIVLIHKNKQTKGLNDEWVIGVDYGTSNTNLYRKRGEAGMAERWKYNFPEYIKQITFSIKDIRKGLIEEFLFPLDWITLPIPTTLKVYDKSKLSKGKLLLDYFIYIPEELYKFPQEILSDIKWDTGEENRTKYYLEGILFLILIETVYQYVKTVDLVCSFPKAFSSDNEAAYKSAWETAFNNLLNRENPNRILNNREEKTEGQEMRILIKEPVFQTEGDASGEFFASNLTIKDPTKRANKAKSSICLDVGGGTTDLSLWYEDVIEFDTSVLLAGRQISSFMQANRRVRERLFSESAKIALDEKEKEPANFSARLNLILKREEEEIQKRLGDFIHDKDIRLLRKIIALEFGALAYYSGMVCLYANENIKKKESLATHFNKSGITLHWGGNAAKLINWIDHGKFQNDGIAANILNALFFNSLNNKSLGDKTINPVSINQLQSPEHKCEAAGGLVVMDYQNKKINFNSNISSIENKYSYDKEVSLDNDKIIICGENIELMDGNINFYQTISNKELFNKNGSKFVSTKLEKLSHFIDIFNFFGVKKQLFTEDAKIILSEADKRLINDGVYKEFSRMETLDDGNRLIEPIFIMEVKLLLEIIESKMN